VDDRSFVVASDLLPSKCCLEFGNSAIITVVGQSRGEGLWLKNIFSIYFYLNIFIKHHKNLNKSLINPKITQEIKINRIKKSTRTQSIFSDKFID
jgi:hypothetical protein